MNNVPRIVGFDSDTPRKKKRKTLKKQERKKPRQPSRLQRQTMLPVWEDRNVSNRGSKLNP